MTHSSTQIAAPKFVCLNCGMEMIQRQCKVRCERCGYFEDCSDGTGDHVNILYGAANHERRTKD